MKPLNIGQILLGFLLLISTATLARARQDVDIEQAVTNVSALQPGQQAVAAVVIQVKPGFHVQSHAAVDQALMINLESNPAVTFHEPIYPPGTDETYTYSPKPLNVYTGKVTFYIPFEVKSDATPGDAKISGKIQYQACDDKQCYLPAKIPFTIETRIIAAEREG